MKKGSLEKKKSKAKNKLSSKKEVSAVVVPHHSIELGAADRPMYAAVNGHFEYLDLSHKGLGMRGLADLFRDLALDKVLKHLNVAGNLTAAETSVPSKMLKFLADLDKFLQENTTLTALDIGYNDLFVCSEHPINYHKNNYAIELTDVLQRSRIRFLDISGNYVTGQQFYMLKGLDHLQRKFTAPNALAFRCRSSGLHSQGLCAVSMGMGISSSLTYLDLSDNMGGLDPTGAKTSEGMQALSGQLARTVKLRILKLARNNLDDADIAILSETATSVPSLQLLDLSGNLCHAGGAQALSQFVISHSTLDTALAQGIMEIDLSSNPLAMHGVKFICEAVERSTTLTILKLANCDIDNAAMKLLEVSLHSNSRIIYLDISDNPVSATQEAFTKCEETANRLLLSLERDPLLLNVRDLTLADYRALSRKLKFLSVPCLESLHSNPSFNEKGAEMTYELYIVHAPSRKKLISAAKTGNSALLERLGRSAEAERRIIAIKMVYRNIMRWYREVQKANRIKESLLAAQIAAT